MKFEGSKKSSNLKDDEEGVNSESKRAKTRNAGERKGKRQA